MIATAVISGLLGFIAGALFNALAYDKGWHDGYDTAKEDVFVAFREVKQRNE